MTDWQGRHVGEDGDVEGFVGTEAWGWPSEIWEMGSGVVERVAADAETEQRSTMKAVGCMVGSEWSLLLMDREEGDDNVTPRLTVNRDGHS